MRRRARRHLPDTRVLAIIVEGDAGRAPRDRGDLVEGGPGRGPPVAGRHVAVGVVAIAGVHEARAAWHDRGHCMRPHRGSPGGIVAVGTDIGLEGDIAEIVVSNGLGGPARDRVFGDAVQAVVSEGLGEALVCICARRQVRERVIGVGEVGNRVRDARLDEELGVVSSEFRQMRRRKPKPRHDS